MTVKRLLQNKKTKQNGTVKNPQGWFSKQALVIIAGDDSKKIAAKKKAPGRVDPTTFCLGYRHSIHCATGAFYVFDFKQFCNIPS